MSTDLEALKRLGAALEAAKVEVARLGDLEGTGSQSIALDQAVQESVTREFDLTDWLMDHWPAIVAALERAERVEKAAQLLLADYDEPAGVKPSIWKLRFDALRIALAAAPGEKGK